MGDRRYIHIKDYKKEKELQLRLILFEKRQKENDEFITDEILEEYEGNLKEKWKMPLTSPL